MANKKFNNKQLRLYGDWTALGEKFINYIMKDGKKSVARKVYYHMLKEIKKQGHMNPQIVIDTAIENASPTLMVKSKRMGWSVYQVPVEVKAQRRVFFACKWILDAARWKRWKAMYEKLAEEILASYSDQGHACKKKEEVHKMAEANKAYAYMAKYIN